MNPELISYLDKIEVATEKFGNYAQQSIDEHLQYLFWLNLVWAIGTFAFMIILSFIAKKVYKKIPEIECPDDRAPAKVIFTIILILSYLTLFLLFSASASKTVQVYYFPKSAVLEELRKLK